MSAATARISRDALLREIFETLHQWSALERNVFARVHYHGQSLEVISQLLKLDVKELKDILRQCDRRLYASLREFRKNNGDKRLRDCEGTAGMTVHSQELKNNHRLSSKAFKNPGTSRMAI